MLKIMVSITSVAIQVLYVLAIILFLWGFFTLASTDGSIFDSVQSLSAIVVSIFLILILGGIAVGFRLSEQLLEIKNILIMNSDVKVIDKANDDDQSTDKERKNTKARKVRPVKEPLPNSGLFEKDSLGNKICKKCTKPSRENSTFCESCGEQFATKTKDDG